MASTSATKGTGQGQEKQPSATTAFQWLLAWGVFLAILAILNRTRIGHLVIYYVLLLAVLFVLVTQYAWIQAALAPIATMNGTRTDPNVQEEPAAPHDPSARAPASS